MTCHYCGVEAYRGESGRHWCGNRECAGHLCTVEAFGVYGAVPVQVAGTAESPTTLSFRFCGEGEGQVAFTYEEMLALQRVARAQIELEKKRGVNQR